MRVILFSCLLAALSLRATSGQNLATPLSTTFSETVLAFDVVATTNLSVKNFSVQLTAIGSNRRVIIWKRRTFGSASAVINDVSAWEQIATKVVPTPGGYSNLGLTLSEFIPAGETQAFMISGGLMCDTSQPAGTLLAQDSDLTIYHGHGGPIPLQPFNSGRGFSGKVHYTLSPALTFDIRLEEILTPLGNEQDCSLIGVSEVVAVQLRNTGTQAIPLGTLLQLDLDVDGSPVVSDVLLTASTLPAGATFSHIFSATVDLSQGLSHTFDVTLVAANDMDPSNDQLSQVVTSGGLARVTSFPYHETFDSAFNPQLNFSLTPPPGWYQEPNDWSGFGSQVSIMASNGSFTPGVGHGWEFPAPNVPVPFSAFLRLPTGSPSVPPPVGSVTELFSPCIDLANIFNPRLSFWLQWTNGSDFSVDVLDTTTGIRHVGIFSPQVGPAVVGSQNKQVVDLSAFAFSTIRLIFRWQIYNSQNPILDDVMIIDGLAQVGQNTQPGFAEFSSDLSLNIYNDQPSVMSGGPYRVKKSSGDTFHMNFAGQPLQPIWLLTGPLNPQAATFPNIGSMDLGGLPDANGIPVGVSIIADGTQPGLGSLFNLNATGSLALAFSVPVLPLGPYAPFQAAIMTAGANGSWVALSNTIVLDIQ